MAFNLRVEGQSIPFIEMRKTEEGAWATNCVGGRAPRIGVSQ